MTKFARKWRSLHFKLVRTVAYVLVMAILVSGVTMLVVGNMIVKDRNIKSLTVIGDILADKTAFQLGLGAFYAQEAQESLATARFHKDIARACLYDGSGALFAEYSADDIEIGCNTHTDLRDEVVVVNSGFGAVISLPVKYQNDHLGQIVIHSRGEHIQSVILGFALAVLLTLMAAVFIAFVMGSRLIKRTLVPLNELAKTADSISKDPLVKARATKIDHDEVGELVDVFNHMLDVLAHEKVKLLSSEDKFRTLAESSPVGVFLRKSLFQYSYVNSAWEDITGVSLDNASQFIECVSSEFKKDYVDRIYFLKDEGETAVVEFDYTAPNGKIHHLMEYVSVVGDLSGVSYVGSLLDVTELKDAQYELEKLAYYDPLTQLPNRRFLKDHLEFSIAKARKDGRKLAVFMTDLDNFKRVNDTLGHEAGDKLLQSIARRLRESLFREDVVTRMGGDEFLILVESGEYISNLESISERLLKAMNTRAEFEHNSIPVSGSIGVAIFPDDGVTTDELLRYADLALYSAKADGGNAFRCYSDDLDKHIKRQIRLEHKLRKALDDNALDIFFQPQFKACSLEMCWAEVLVRWFDEEDGYIDPSVFIPVAEDTGLIHRVGRFVIERSLEIMSREKDAFKQLGLQGLSINLSAKQFFAKDIVEHIAHALAQYDVLPSQVEFEITESMVMEDVEQAIVLMEEIRALGCRFAIDDFGTGYSSLGYLKRFPLTNLKIDRSFICDIPDDANDTAIACAIIDLAHNLDMSVVAEGVETKIQADLLGQKGCDYLQGYLLSKPVSIADLLAMPHK